MAPGVHVHPLTVRFGDCDPAGIVYFPRYFDWWHQAMETWFDDALDLPYAELISLRRIGFPCVRTEADFKRPCKPGDAIGVELRVEGVGRSSLRFAYAVRPLDVPDAELRATGASVVALMDLDPTRPTFRRAIAMPADLRERIERFLKEGPIRTRRTPTSPR